MSYKIRKFGHSSERRDYSKTKVTLETPDFLEPQRESFEWFLKEGIEESLNKIYPIISTNGKIEIQYVPGTVRVDVPENEFNAIKEAKQKGTSYVGKIYALLRKHTVETGELDDKEVLYGEVPLMTSGGTFIINGSEKVIVAQLIRSAGAYFGKNVRNKQADDLFNKVEILPQLGSWIEIFHRVTGNSTDTVKIRIDKHKNIPLVTFLNGLGLKKETFTTLFGNSEVLQESLKKEKVDSSKENLETIYRIIRKGDRITDDAVANLIPLTLFNDRRYNLSKTGRYMLNRKLNLVERILETYLAQDLVSVNGEVLFKKGTFITPKIALKIQRQFDNEILPTTEIPDITPEVYGKQLEAHKNLINRNKVVMVKVWPNKKSLELNKEPILVIANDPTSTEMHLLISDLIATVSYYFNLIDNLGKEDDPDSLVNKRVVGVGELLQNQFLIGLTKLEKHAKEKLSSKELEKINPKTITNNKPIYNQFKSFFNTSKLSQFMDQINPLAEIANKRRVTSLGPGGLNRDTAQFEVRDVHATHYGRICPIETPEGQNIGLILNLASYSKVDKHGFIQAPYYPVEDGIINYDKVEWLTAVQEYGFTFAQSSIEVDENNKIIGDLITVRKDHQYLMVKPTEVDYIDVASKQMTSIASSAIPFLENDDANRALMGANMQRQAVPLIDSEAPLVGTGVEYDVAKYAATNLRAKKAGKVIFVDSQQIKIQEQEKGEITNYNLRIFERSNQGTVITQKPIVKVGDVVEAGDLICDGPSTKDGELALGKNVLVAFTTWNGFNYEDAIIISEKLVKDDVYTSIHIEEQTIQFRASKAGDDILTYDIPNASTRSKRHLDENGIVRIGSEVSTGDILVGRTSPKGEDNPTPEEKLMNAIFGNKASNQKDTSLKVKNGDSGTVIDVQILSRAQGDVLEDGIDKIIKVFIAQKRKIKVGDKMAGRHGNKGVISLVLPVEDMPYLEDGTPVDILLNPQGVPSRMNIGQVLELHLGMAAKKLNVKFVSPVFDGVKNNNITSVLKEANLPTSGKFKLYDGMTGIPFDNEVSVGVMYMLKLQHMVDDKMNARSVGPYSLITQQPLGGKSQNGGQRFGEMETWALEAFGATTVLQEILTYKSDNIQGRNILYNVLATGGRIPKPGMPESFNVLAYELRGLGIKLEVHKKENYQEADFSEVEREIQYDSNEISLEDEYSPDIIKEYLSKNNDYDDYNDEDGEY
ncbi:DNA-directed RNA polymerase subunit beta [Mesomycoplasma lagogenitalium]|uniref:DNA-directed RNA polymerase subunit beta n=2 Tax=Mesomycoplasma lagogenitalium TaxID=171286 RepID=A0ABY8LSS5_9BACT|nr:DNA-directed RNA polymerase subunit beta [Mesomycoplasma lagogenitalium]WGI36310.1 DNA-directed RNA polymerase subunit beta [Mesomycoplasma lagogenitalium]